MDFLMRWLAPDAAPGAYNDWRLVFAPHWGQAELWWLAAVVILVASAATVRGLLRLPPRRRTAILVLRLLAMLWLFFLLLEPAIELRAVSRTRSRLAVLVDDSRSMALDTSAGTRMERVLAHLSDNASTFAELGSKAALEWYLFSDRVRPLEGMPTQLEAPGTRTDLARAVSEVSWQGSGRDLGGVLIYSDGTDTEGLTVSSARRSAEALGVPVHVVAFGDDDAAPDLAIRRIPADDFAFVHNTVTLDVDLEVRGLDLSTVDVTLEHEGSILQTKAAQLEGGTARVSFEVVPRSIGKQVYRVSVPVQAGESVTSNNAKSVVLEVIRDRIRILHVAGRPSWDQRFLRELLKRNPSVDLISFFILRSTTDLQKASQDELALIPFPVHELFTEELDTFDIVIYQNFSYRPYRMDRYLPNLREYVLGGGSFLMVGGDQSFEEGWYAGTAVEDVLPVRLGGAEEWDATPFRPRLTAAGRLHPITRIGEPGEPPEAVLGRLPPLEGFNDSLGLAPGATALMEHPSLPGNPPLVAIREVGEGRSLSVSTDSSWFWRFVSVGEGGAGREFDRLWSSAIRWLIRDPDLARVRLRPDRSVALLGEPFGVDVRVLGPDYQPRADTEVRLTVERRYGEGPVPEERLLRTGPRGLAVTQFDDLPPGTYELRAEAEVDGTRVETARAPIIVEAADVELQLPFPRPELLRALADASGGSFILIDESLPSLDVADVRRTEVDRSRRVPIWSGFTAFLILFGLVAAEQWLRRRRGVL